MNSSETAGVRSLEWPSGLSISTATQPEFDTQFLAGIRAALRKARELGYEVERMDVTASLFEGGCSVHFAPITAPGTIATGGDLTLTIDPRTGAVVEIKRGQ